MTLVQTDSKQFGLKDDMRIPFTEVAAKLGVSITLVHKAAKEGKLEDVTFAGQGGWGADTVYNNETTPRAVKKWRAGVRKYTRRPVTTATISIKSENRKAA